MKSENLLATATAGENNGDAKNCNNQKISVFKDAGDKLIKQFLSGILSRKENIDIDAIVDRLRKDAIRACSDYFEIGKEEGFQWAESASFTDLVYVSNHEYYMSHDTCMFNEYDEVWVEVVFDLFEDDQRLGRGGPSLDLNPLMDSWVKGWFAGIDDFWSLVKDKVLA